MMGDYMKEAERLLGEYADARVDFLSNGTPGDIEARAALLSHIQHGAVPEGDDGKRVLREVFALCEDTETKCSDETGDFARGRRFEAKGIARAIGAWYQEEFCGRTQMGEPAAPDQFRNAAKMMAAPAEVPMPEPVGWVYWCLTGYSRDTRLSIYEPRDHEDRDQIAAMTDVRTYGDAREAAGYARGRADERERICAAIKAEDDYCVTEGDYMLDSEDCISVARGTWERPDYAALRGEVKP